MAKESSQVSREQAEEVIVRTPRAHHASRQADTKTVVVAVGASIILFTIGLILGYLLGHQTADSRGSGSDDSMMNRNGNFRGTMPYRTSTTTQSTAN